VRCLALLSLERPCQILHNSTKTRHASFNQHSVALLSVVLSGNSGKMMMMMNYNAAKIITLTNT